MAEVDVGELHFVDHVECKIHSPEKEVITPTKSSKVEFPIMLNGDGKVDHLEAESKNCDSGLDSSNDSSDIPQEQDQASQEVEKDHFIDRQESHTSVDDPEIILSPTKQGQEPFSYEATENQSLDAANNNTEVVVNVADDRPKGQANIEVEVVDSLYLGKEVSLHDKGDTDLKDETVKTDENVKEKRETSSATMNLYWYSGSAMNVDLDEIEAFKNSQGETFTSSLQITTGNGYYKTKSQTELVDTEVSRLDVTENRTDKKSEVSNKDRWSPAFESASSRILGLASELKSQPKSSKADETKGRKDEHHPWGLEREEKFIDGRGDVSAEILPDIDSYHSESDVNFNVTDKNVKDHSVPDSTDEVDAENKGTHDIKTGETLIESEDIDSVKKSPNIELYIDDDEADAIGYMELTDKPRELTVTEKDKKNMDNEISRNNNKANEENDLETDAVGYIELADKPIEQTFVSVEQTSLEADVKDDATKKLANQNNSSEQFISPVENQPISCEHKATIYGMVTDDALEDKVDGSGIEPIFDSVEQTSLKADVQDDATKKLANQNNSSEQLISPVKSQPVSCEHRATVYGMVTDDAVEGKAGGSGMAEIVMEDSVVMTETVPLETVKKELVKDPYTVKRTYNIMEDSEALIQNIGGIFIETETLVDEYLDDNDFTLTLKDCWLRLRNKKFEMKLNAGFGCANGKAKLLTSEMEIKEALFDMFSKELEQRRKVSENQLDVLVDSLAMVEFTTFETERKRYQVGNCNVTVDITNFGVQNGHIEMVASSPSEIPQVLTTLEKLSADLGFRPLQNE